MPKADNPVLAIHDPNNRSSQPIQAAAAEIVALINSRPNSPTQDDIEKIIANTVANAAADCQGNAEFQLAVAEYQRAEEAINAACRAGASDGQLSALDAKCVATAIALVQAPCVGARDAWKLLDIAIDRLSQSNPEDMKLDPGNSDGIYDRINIACVIAAHRALGAAP